MTEQQTEPDVAEVCQRHQLTIHPASRVMFCGRCGHATGGGQGHFYSWCSLTNQKAEFHFCCPGSCALVDGEEMDPVAPCHPAPGTYKEWARAIDAGKGKSDA